MPNFKSEKINLLLYIYRLNIHALPLYCLYICLSGSVCFFFLFVCLFFFLFNLFWFNNDLKGMGPWLVLVSPCLREIVIATCKIGSFLCNLDNLLQKKVIVLFFGNQISKWRSFEKRAIFDLLFTFFSHQGKLQKFLQHISHSHTYTYFAHPIAFFFCLTNFEKNTNLSYTVSSLV